MQPAEPGEWTRSQKLVVLATALAIIFDGFDVQLMAFAIPAIVKDWQVTRQAFGSVLALGLGGMAAGAVFAGPMGDRLGRRVTLIGCVFLFAAATLAAGLAGSMTTLAILRFIAGAGLGGALPNAAALTAEFTPPARRAFAVSLTIVCVPLGGMLAGAVAARVLPVYGWRTLFVIGGIAPLVVAVVLLFVLPESPLFLARQAEKWDISALFAKGMLGDTLSLWLAFVANLIGVFLVFSWLPAVLSAAGLSLVESASGLTWFNFGGVLGALLCGYIASRAGSRVPLLVCAAGATLSALALRGVEDHQTLIWGFGVSGFFVNAVQTTMYALATHVYPTRIRATGLAFALALGRGGSIASALIGAALVQTGLDNYLLCLAVLPGLAFVGLALVSRHIPRPA